MKMAIYARVSSEKQEKQETIQSQIEALRDYAKKNNYVACGEYIDDGYSGELLDRPALDKLRDDAKKKLFEAVLVHSPDRFSRKFIYLGLVQEELKKSGVNIVFLNRPDSKDTPEDNLLNGVQGLIAEYEKAKILERTRRGKLHKAKTGLLVTSIAPYGYRYIPQDKVHNKSGCYEVNPEEAIIVGLIFDLFVNKQMSIRAIARELTRREILPRKGKHWRTSTLHRIIRNEAYIGTAYYNKHIAMESQKPKQENTYRRRKNTSLHLRPREQWISIQLPEHLRIVDKEIFDLAQAQLKRNSELSPRNVKHHYLLRGLLQCGECNSPYLGTPCHNRLFYRCGNRHRVFPLPKECSSPMRSAPMLEGVVWSAISEAVQQPQLIIKQVKNLQSSRSKQSKETERDLQRVETALANTQNEEDRLLDAYRNGIIDIEQLQAQMVKIQEKKNSLTQERQRLTEKSTQNVPRDLLKRSVKEHCKAIKSRLKHLTADEKQQILRLLVNRIILERDKVRIRGVIPLYDDSGNIASQLSERCAHREATKKTEGIKYAKRTEKTDQRY